MRIIKEIEIEGKNAWALFDTDSLHTFVSKRLLEGALTGALSKPYRVTLGGKPIEVKEYSLIQGKIEWLDFQTQAVPIDEIGTADGQTLDAIIGALTMRQWEIFSDPNEGTLDLSGLERRRFTEFAEQFERN